MSSELIVHGIAAANAGNISTLPCPVCGWSLVAPDNPRIANVVCRCCAELIRVPGSVLEVPRFYRPPSNEQTGRVCRFVFAIASAYACAYITLTVTYVHTRFGFDGSLTQISSAYLNPAQRWAARLPDRTVSFLTGNPLAPPREGKSYRDVMEESLRREIQEFFAVETPWLLIYFLAAILGVGSVLCLSRMKKRHKRYWIVALALFPFLALPVFTILYLWVGRKKVQRLLTRTGEALFLLSWNLFDRKKAGGGPLAAT